jgi:hypothetical protein
MPVRIATLQGAINKGFEPVSYVHRILKFGEGYYDSCAYKPKVSTENPLTSDSL